ncbi:MAG: hypothetical protein E4H41_07125, partial [Gemmatimonadales bacterium]
MPSRLTDFGRCSLRNSRAAGRWCWSATTSPKRGTWRRMWRCWPEGAGRWKGNVRPTSRPFTPATPSWSMVEFMRLAFAIAGKDIRLELRSRTALLSAIVFSALVLVVFNFARDPTAIAAVDLAPSVLWVTFAFGAVIALNRAFYVERENAALDGILLAPVPRSALYVGKLLANLAFVGVVEAVALPLFVLFFNVSI